MKQRNYDHQDNTEKLELILRKLERIEQKVAPPAWKSPLNWLLNHWLLVLFMGGLAWGMWHLWDEIRTIMGFVENMNTSVETMKSGWDNLGAGAGKVSDSITDTIRKSIEDFKIFGQ